MKSFKDTVSKFYSVQESVALDEVLTAKTPTSKWIDDFVKSDNSKFAGKSKKERIQMALGAAYAAKRQNEDLEIDLEEVNRLAESFDIEIINEVTADDWLKGAEEARVDAMKAKSEDKMPKFHEHMADHHEHLINYHELKGNQKNADAHYKKMMQHIEDESRLSEEVEELEEGRPSQQHPLEDHPYHKKSNAELEYIAKDAREAAEAMKGHNTAAENKYTDQANDSATVRYWRQKNGMPAWYKKKYELDEYNKKQPQGADFAAARRKERLASNGRMDEEVFPVEEVFDLDEMVGASMSNTRKLTHHIQGLGWKLTRTTGSHDVFTHSKSEQHIAVPRHKELKAPLVLSILKIAKVPKLAEETEIDEGRGFRGVDGARYREDDENHALDKGNWYIRAHGKNLTDAKGTLIPFTSMAAANAHALKHADKHGIPLTAMHLTKSWMDAPDKMAEAFMPAISASIAGSQGSMGRASAKAALLRKRATPRNFVAKHAPTTGAGSHGNKKKENKNAHSFMEDSVVEAKKMKDTDPCWTGYEMIGTKKKNGKEVPNCVPVKEAKDAGEYDYEGSMAKTLLQTICRNAEDMKNMLEDDENLPEWVQSKITKAEDYITSSLDYLKSTQELGEEVEQIDELSKKTLSSYIDKADTNVRDLSRKWVSGTKAQKDAAYAKIDKKISDRFDSMDKAVTKLKESSIVPAPTHVVVDSKTGAVVSKHASLKTASRSANRRDQEYGAVRYIVKPITK